MMVKRSEKCEVDVLELHRVGARRRPFQADDVGDLGQPLDHAESEMFVAVQKVL